MPTSIPKYGDIVIVIFPHSTPESNSQIKARPALVIQADNLNTGLSQVILAQITSRVQQRASHPCRVTIYVNDPIAQGTGLIKDSVIMTDKLATLDRSLIHRTIGRISDMASVKSALRVTFDL